MFQTETIRVVLKKELDMPIIEMSDENARLDGGDVLFTGKVKIITIIPMNAIYKSH